MDVSHVALTALDDRDHELARRIQRVASALQTQALRDVAPEWGVYATVDAFQSLEDVPPDHWLVLVVDKDFPLPGYHGAVDGTPTAFVRDSDSWSFVASHELIEMLIDPWGRCLFPGPSPKLEQGYVNFVIEACDPCQDPRFAYTIDGVLVSDFVTPSYYGPRTKVLREVEAAGGSAQAAGAWRSSPRFSFSGMVTQRLEVLPGGYLSWLHDGEFWQSVRSGNDAPQNMPLGQPSRRSGPPRRAFIDNRSDAPVEDPLSKENEPLETATIEWTAAERSARQRAVDVRGAVRDMTDRQPTMPGGTDVDVGKLEKFLKCLADPEQSKKLVDDPERVRQVLHEDFGIEVPEGVIPRNPTLPPPELVNQVLIKLKGDTRSQQRAIRVAQVFAALGRH